MTRDIIVIMNDDILTKLITLEPSAESLEPAPLVIHPRLNQVLAWSMGTHPNVEIGQVWENMDVREGDEYGLLQCLVTDIQGTSVQLCVVSVDSKSARGRLGETFEVSILKMRPEDGSTGWVPRSFIIPLNARGEARPDVTFPRKTSSITKVAKENPFVTFDKPKTSLKSSTADKAKTDSSSNKSSVITQLSKDSKSSDESAKKDKIAVTVDSEVKSISKTAPEENVDIVVHALVGTSEITSLETSDLRQEVKEIIKENGFISVLHTVRAKNIMALDAKTAREKIETYLKPKVSADTTLGVR